MAGLTTIPLSKDTREELKQVGFKKETYDEIIRKLVESYKRQLFYARQKRILEEERFVPLGKI